MWKSGGLFVTAVASVQVWCGGASAQFIGSEPRGEVWIYEYCTGPGCAPPAYGYSAPPPAYGYGPPPAVYGYTAPPPAVYGYTAPPPAVGYIAPPPALGYSDEVVNGYLYAPYPQSRNDPPSNACYYTCTIEYAWPADQCRQYCAGRP